MSNPDRASRLAGRTPRRSTLADGRPILYFDDPGRDYGSPPRDERDLPPYDAVAELRHDPLLDEPVLLAAHRQDRTHLPSTRECPLCPTRRGARTEIPATEYDVAVFENRFPSLPTALPDGSVAGRCEVIAYASDHDASFAGLTQARLDTIAAAWIHRTEELRAAPGVEYVFCFENRGEKIGVTLHHPHGQVYAYPYRPPRVARLLEVALAGGACPGCEQLAVEEADGRRIVVAGPSAVAYVPRAARWPYEVHVVPRRHVADLAGLSLDERGEIVRLQADVLTRLDRLFDRPIPYMAGWLQAPATTGRDAWHLRLQIASPQRAGSKLKYLASSESLMGAFINDVRPEDAAARLRSLA